MDCQFLCGTCGAHDAGRLLNDMRKTIKMIDLTLANTSEVNADQEDADVLDDWVGQMYEIITKRSRENQNQEIAASSANV